MLRLVRWEDLHVVEVIQCAHRLRLRGGVIRERRNDVQSFEHVTGQIGGVSARGQSERDVLAFTGVDDGGDGGVEGERLVPAAGEDGELYGSGFAWGFGDIPIRAAGVVVAGFDWGADVRVDPEWPECIVEIKGDQFRERKAVVEGGGRDGGIF